MKEKILNLGFKRVPFSSNCVEFQGKTPLKQEVMRINFLKSEKYEINLPGHSELEILTLHIMSHTRKECWSRQILREPGEERMHKWTGED